MSADPFANDPAVRRMEKTERINRAKNWREQRATFNRGLDLEHPGPCPNCGADTIARDGFDWCCAECGVTRFASIAGEEE